MPCGFAPSAAVLLCCAAGLRIATPVCALVRNDMLKHAAVRMSNYVLPGQIRSFYEFALSTAVLLCPAARRADCPVASLLAIITCFHTTINENVIYWRYGRSLMSYPRSGRRILQPFQFGKEDQLLSEKTTKSRLAPQTSAMA